MIGLKKHIYDEKNGLHCMKPKTLQYFMGHSDIVVTLNVYTHIGLDDATEELRKLEEMENAVGNWTRGRRSK